MTAASERLHSVLVALQQGSHGLLQRVQPYMSLVDSGVFELTSISVGIDETETWAETMDALNTSEQILSKMLEIISGGGDNNVPTKIANGLEPIIDGKSTSIVLLLLTSFNLLFVASDSISTEPPSMSTNVRILSRKVKRDTEETDSGPIPRNSK